MSDSYNSVKDFVTTISEVTNNKTEVVSDVLKTALNYLLHEIAISDDRPVVITLEDFVRVKIFELKDKEIKISISPHRKIYDRFKQAYFDRKDLLCERLIKDYGDKLKNYVIEGTVLEDGEFENEWNC